MESLKEFMAEVRGVGVDVKNKIIRLIGKSTWEDEPTLTMEEISDQIRNITGESISATTPRTTLVLTKEHLDKDLSTIAVHGITGFSSSVTALASSSSAGSAKTVSRGDHVHPYPTAANVGAMSITHPADAITGFYTLAGKALGTAAAGTSTLVSRGDHVHPYPTPTQIGAANDIHYHGAADVNSGIFNIARIPTGTTSTTVAFGNHTHSTYALTSHTHSYHPYGGNNSTSLNASSIYAATSISTGGGITVTGNVWSSVGNITADTGGVYGNNMYSNGFVQAGFGVNAGFRMSNGTGFFLNTSSQNIIRGNGTFIQNLAGNNVFLTCSNVNETSDPTLKKDIVRGWVSPTNINIQEFAYNAVITFRFKYEDDDAPVHHGFDAALIKDYAPFAAVDIPGGGENGEDILGISPTAIVAYLTQVIADQDRRIEALESEMEQIKISQQPLS